MTRTVFQEPGDAPDGKRIAFVSELGGGGRKGQSVDAILTVADADWKNRKDVYRVRETSVYRTHAGLTAVWSPDGGRLAVLHQEDHPERGAAARFSARVVVMTADGSSHTEVYKADGSHELMGFDWK